MKKYKILIVALILLLIILARISGLSDLLTLENLKLLQADLESSISKYRIMYYGIYCMIYIISVAVNIPGATILTLAGGALFGVFTGTILVSFSSTTGAALSFLVSRFILRETVQKRFSGVMTTINKGIEKDGVFYLLTLRLVPLFPFFLINLLMGLTRMKLWVYVLISATGMLPATIIYVNAGTQLASITSLSDIASVPVLVSLLLLGIFPLFAKSLISYARTKRKFKGFKKPGKFDYNLVVIGGGAAGLVSSIIASTVNAKVALIEQHTMGGDCLNTGCVPSKTILAIARKIRSAEKLSSTGFIREPIHIAVDFNAIKSKIREVISTIEPNDSVERYTSLGVDCMSGHASIVSPWMVKVDGKLLTTQKIIIASGASPFIPPIPGLSESGCYTSDTIWDMEKLPGTMTILGGGPIGCELAQAFSGLGVKVTIVEMADRLCNREDEEAGKILKEIFETESIQVLIKTKAVSFTKADSGLTEAVLERTDGEKIVIQTECVLAALGRKAITKNLGLETIGVTLNKDGTVAVDDFMCTDVPTVYACGDVAGPYQFTHTASHTAWYATVNSLFGGFKKFKKDFRVIPKVTYTEPEIASVGITESEAKESNIPFEVTKFDLKHLDRAIAEDNTKGFVKIITSKGSDTILGAVIVAPTAGEMLSELTMAMKCNVGLNKILSIIHPYPVWSEAVKFTAGMWKKNRKPEKLLKILEWYFSMIRRAK